MMKHKGYVGVAKIDAEAGVIRGRVINTRDVITFQGRSVEEARQAFVDSVEDYLEFCATRGEVPDKPYSGRLLVRITPKLHKTLAVQAGRRGKSLNAYIDGLLTAAAEGRAARSDADDPGGVAKRAAGAAEAPAAKPRRREEADR
jgi:predicted HicB family RNase H-like nuclease